MRSVSNMILLSSTFVGWAVWLVAAVAMSGPLIGRVLLLAPLVIVPRLLCRLDVPSAGSLGGWPAVVAALPLCVAFAQPPGLVAAVLTVPWIIVAVLALGATVRHLLPRLRSMTVQRDVREFGQAGAVGFLAVGATFIATDRLGLRPLGFSAIIILLTAVHFTFAGFGLLTISSGLAPRLRPAGFAVVGLIAGIPITALGFVADSLWVGALGAVVVGVSGFGVGISLLAAAPGRATAAIERLAWRIAGLCLLVAMPLGIGWSLALLFGGSLLPLDAMVRTHGFLNALAVTLVAMSDEGLVP
jgi:YndJ-like protein